MELFLIRHGQSANNALADPALRVEDPWLTPAGEQQAERVAAYLAARRHLHADARDGARPVFDQLYCSPMIRAMQTARPIARTLAVRCEVWVDIHEIGGIYLDRDGRKVGYAGQTRSQLLQHFPECALPHDVSERGWWNRDFEEAHVGYARAVGVARALRARADEDTRVGLVSHGDFLSELLKSLCDEDIGDGGYYQHRNTAITHVDLTPLGARVRYLNRVDHLDDALLTY
jgi:2,3-bisphosphoglycerate-dependent phosphoglycerate mutase